VEGCGLYRAYPVSKQRCAAEPEIGSDLSSHSSDCFLLFSHFPVVAWMLRME